MAETGAPVGGVERRSVNFLVAPPGPDGEVGDQITGDHQFGRWPRLMPDGFPVASGEFDLPVVPEGWNVYPTGAWTRTANGGVIVEFARIDKDGRKRGTHAAKLGGDD